MKNHFFHITKTKRGTFSAQALIGLLNTESHYKAIVQSIKNHVYNMIVDKNSCFSLKKIFEEFPADRTAQIYALLKDSQDEGDLASRKKIRQLFQSKTSVPVIKAYLSSIINAKSVSSKQIQLFLVELSEICSSFEDSKLNAYYHFLLHHVVEVRKMKKISGFFLNFSIFWKFLIF